MNKEIVQICQKIDIEDILCKKSFRVWFFTNERNHYFFPKLEQIREMQKVFCVGGGGDFAFSLLSTPLLNQINEVNVCDIRPMANITVDLKTGLFKNLGYEEILDLFLKQTSFQTQPTYKRIRETITPLSRTLFDQVIAHSKEDQFLSCLKKSGLWYGDSFWQIKNKEVYLPYLASKERYERLQKNLDHTTLFCGDVCENLKLFGNTYFDLIYLSNILDSRKYCPNPHEYLQTIKNKLRDRGFLFVVTQHHPKQIIRLVEKEGFRLCKKELRRFNLLTSLLGHYSYSFLLFEK